MAPGFSFGTTPLEKTDRDEPILITEHREAAIIGQELINGCNFEGKSYQLGDTVTAKYYTYRLDVLVLPPLSLRRFPGSDA